MASSDYLLLVQAARQKVLRISAQQSRDIARIYAEIAADLRRESAKHGAKTLTYRFLVDYAKNLRKESEEIFAGQRDLITGNLRAAAGATVEAQRAFFAQAAPQLSRRFSDVFSRASQKAVNELLSGGIYENFAGLSERIWNYRGSFDRDISEIIRRGILAKKPAFDLAKDLELYLDPSAAKPWDWSRVYPGVSCKVDYNAQRLARTSVTHAYQLALERSTRDNPFVTQYQWLVSNSHARICGLCLSRDGKYFDKGSVPLDHPNGMCTIIPVIEKSYEEIAAELADWANGGENPALDNWLTAPTSSESGSTGASIRIGTNNVDFQRVQSAAYRRKFSNLTQNSTVNDSIRRYANAALTHNNGTDSESLFIVDTQNGHLLFQKHGRADTLGVELSAADIAFIRSHKGTIIGIHNHPTNLPPTGSDFVAAGYRGYSFGIVVTHDGRVFQYSAGDRPFLPTLLDSKVDKYCGSPYNMSVENAFEKALDELREESGATCCEK